MSYLSWSKQLVPAVKKSFCCLKRKQSSVFLDVKIIGSRKACGWWKWNLTVTLLAKSIHAFSSSVLMFFFHGLTLLVNSFNITFNTLRGKQVAMIAIMSSKGRYVNYYHVPIRTTKPATGEHQRKFCLKIYNFFNVVCATFCIPCVCITYYMVSGFLLWVIFRGIGKQEQHNSMDYNFQLT